MPAVYGMQCTLTAAVAVSLNGPLRLLAALLLVAFLAGHVMWLAITQQVDGPEQFTERHKGSQGPSLTPSTKELSSNPYDQERSIDNWMATSLHNTADGQPKPRQTSVLFYDPHRKSKEISNHRSLGSFSGEPWSKPKVAELITEPFRDVTSLLERHGRQAGDSSATTIGGDFQCDTVGMLSNNLAICFRDGNIFSRKCVPCGRNQYWTGTWCEVEQVRLDCRPCPGVTYINHTSHYLKKCEEPDKSDCTLGIHACQDDCTVMADTYVCLCRNGRRLNEDAATCYDALELNIQVEAVYTPPGDDQVSESEIKRQLVLSIVQKLPKVTEAGENDFHQSDESLSAWVSVVVNGSAGGHYQTAAVTAALISLSGQESTTEDGHTFRYLELTVNGLPVNEESDQCQVLSAIKVCPPSLQCVLRGGRAACSVETKLPLKTIGIVLGFHSVLALFTLVLFVLSVIMVVSVRLESVTISDAAGVDLTDAWLNPNSSTAARGGARRTRREKHTECDPRSTPRDTRDTSRKDAGRDRHHGSRHETTHVHETAV